MLEEKSIHPSVHFLSQVSALHAESGVAASNYEEILLMLSSKGRFEQKKLPITAIRVVRFYILIC